MKAAAEAGRLKRAPPRVPRRMQKVRAWARVRARGQRGRITRVAKRQVVACTRGGLEYLGSVYIYISLSVLLGRGFVEEGGGGGCCSTLGSRWRRWLGGRWRCICGGVR